MEESDEVVAQKVAEFAGMIRDSKYTCIFTGYAQKLVRVFFLSDWPHPSPPPFSFRSAGISTSAGIKFVTRKTT